MGVELNFDATSIEPTDFEPMPEGVYPAKIINSAMKPTKDGTGSYLLLEWEVVGNKFAGRKLFERLNLENKNQVAVEIARKTLSSICRAVNVLQVQDSSQLHGIVADVRVAVKPGNVGADGKQYQASNEIKGYKAREGDTQEAAVAPVAKTAAPPWAAHAAPTAAPVATAKAPAAIPPWAKSR